MGRPSKPPTRSKTCSRRTPRAPTKRRRASSSSACFCFVTDAGSPGMADTSNGPKACERDNGLMGSTFKIVRVIVASSLVSACLFPDLSGLKMEQENTTDAASDVAPDVASDASGPCPDVSDPSLEAYYRLDEGAGTTTMDCSSHGRTGTMTGAPGTWTTGKHGAALVVSSSGGTGCVDIPTFQNITGALTVAAWVRVDKAPAPDLPGCIVDKSFNLAAEGWRMSTDASNTSF